uniref:Uncharacterized protein n=1 Tax=Aegilops tauschii subsp. strangulata TaxID=200361 RepID=A0A452YV34_AEGTS
HPPPQLSHPSHPRSRASYRIPIQLLLPTHALRASNSTGNGSGAALLQPQQPPAIAPPRPRRLRVAGAAAALAVSDFRSEVIAARMGDLGVRVVGRGCAAPMEPRKEMAPPSLEQQQQQPPLFMDFSRRDGVADGGNGRKRPRETVAPPARLFSLQAPQGSPGHKVIHLAQLHRRPPATGLRLDFDEGGSEHAACTSSTSPLIPGELAAQCGRYSNEIDRLLQEHVRIR